MVEAGGRPAQREQGGQRASKENVGSLGRGLRVPEKCVQEKTMLRMSHFQTHIDHDLNSENVFIFCGYYATM